MRSLLLTLALCLTACGGRVVLGDEPTAASNEPLTEAGAPSTHSGPHDADTVDAPVATDDAGCTGDECFSTHVCSLVGGTWDVTYNVFYGTNASFQFASDGTFIGGPRAAALPAGAIYSGQWTLNLGYGWSDDAGVVDDAGLIDDGSIEDAGDVDDAGADDAGTEVTLSNTTGMQCNSSFETNMSLTFGPQCTTATLVVETDACTGSRLYFDATTILTRR